jgi:phosphatidylserine/phosphatidylglycerophosphate/cardiolipin synthase-like enzyme
MLKLLRNASLALAFTALSSAMVSGDSVEIFYGPRGGFSRINNSRTLRFSDSSTRPATLANALLHRIDQLEPGSTVKIAMYSMSDYATLDAMLQAAYDKQIKFLLILDGVSSWSAASREKISKAINQMAEKAAKDNRPFDFQLAAVSEAAMKRNGRESKLEDGSIIYGTMHEKFGVFYRPGNPVPHSCFNGSANISPTSDQIYAENRVFFDDQPAVARQFAEEFARLWNEYSEMIVGNRVPEKYVEASDVPGYVKIVFNSEPVSELELTRIDNELINLIRRVEASGSMDLAMFSLTRTELADAILRSAERNPDARFRLLLDHAQLDDSDPLQNKLGPWLEKKASELGLKNIETRYRFRKNAYGYSAQDKKPMLLSYLSLFLHHKNVTVNGKEMAIGSYNWSNSAEYLNFENVMFFNSHCQRHQKLIDSFQTRI